MTHSSDPTLSPAETRNLHRIAGMMLPASEEYDVPSANDPDIFADIVRSLGRDVAAVRAALAELTALGGSPFADLDTLVADSVAASFHGSGTANAATLGRVILQCYYRDDRVLQSLGIEPRPPFPRGHVVEQGDWSLLDAVRSRPQLWRDDRAV